MGLRPEPKDRTYPSSLDRSVRYSSFETFSTRSLPHHRRKPPASIAISQLSRPPGGRAEKRRLVCDREQERKPGIGSLLRDRGSFLPQRSSRVSTAKGGRTRRRRPRVGCVPRGYLSGCVHRGPWCFARPLRNGDDLLREKFSLAFDVGGQVEGLNRFPRMQLTSLGCPGARTS
jgi:hypothetical protein